MIPASFDYIRARSVDEAMSLLAEHGGDAKLLAGGHSLLPLLKLRLAVPELVIDIGELSELSYVEEQADQWLIGALTPHYVLEQAGVPLLSQVAAGIGDPQVRHRGTIGGSLAHGDPAGDLAVALLAAGGSVVARGPGGERPIAADDLFTGFLETALAPDEVLVIVRIPKQLGPVGYQKITRRGIDWATVGVAVADGRVALANMGTTPLRARATEAALAAGAAPEDAAALAADNTSPPSDLTASADFRRHLARVLTRRVLEQAASE